MNFMSWVITGAVINAFAILFGCALGFSLKSKLPKKFSQSLIIVLGICVVIFGVKSALKFENIFVLLASLVLGGLLGELLQMEEKIASLLNRMTKSKKTVKNHDWLIGAITSTVLFCTGAMAVVGAIDSGLRQSHEVLIAKALIDGFISVSFAATYGWSVALSAFPTFFYEAGISVLAKALPFLGEPQILAEVSGVGGVLLILTGLKMCNLVQVSVANYMLGIPICIVLAVWNS
jgi:uncharacterized protein